ncbi:hypothetical protein MRB53_000645 [Persea americana]|uniref:Uncharacterized protein n=1 Tax=Persea americana TaxID=3435 RepID=A0ACC2MPE3_PERAE|nr:hypothetical protein MRB53_000645 [Persea americana]
MAGRNPKPPHILNLRDYKPPILPHPSLLQNPNPLPHPSQILEDRLAAQHHELQTLLLDNQRLAATHVALKQELSAADLELRRVSSVATDLKADRDARIRDIYEQSLELEAELRSLNAAAEELELVRSDIQKLSAARRELSLQLQAVTADLANAHSELQHVPDIQAELEGMQKEIQRGRAAVEYEKKARADNLEQSEAMEKSMISMAQEIEKLRVELANAEKRARAAAAAAAAANPGPMDSGTYGDPEVGYGGSSYVDAYSMYQVLGAAETNSSYGSEAVSHGTYDLQRTQVQGAAESGPQYGSGAVSHGAYDLQQSHVQGAVDSVSQYGSAAVPHSSYEMQQAHVHDAADNVSPYGYGAVSHGAYDSQSHGVTENGSQYGPGAVSHGAHGIRRANANK